MRTSASVAAVALLAVGLLPEPGRAQPAAPPAAEAAAVDPARLAAAREALSAPSLQEQFTSTVRDLVLPTMRAQLEAEPAFREEWRDPFLEAVQAAYEANRAGFVEAAARAYARIFTVAELRDIGVFMRTPGGRAFLERQLQLIQAEMAANAEFGATLDAEINRRFEQTLRERGLPLPSDVDPSRQRL